MSNNKVHSSFQHTWWKGGVIYQIYPRSFQDSNGDGIGDLPGITSRLDYIASLGVDAIWLSPFFKSPMKDFGYDVSDYCDVDPMFGSIDDFKVLLDKAHALGIKVMIDLVLSHTSDQHPWFKESRSSRDNPKADWYVWADPKQDGTPPNNWLSIFGGSAWQWDTRRQQYYLHNFLSSQPDLNFHCAEVQDALLQTVKFWLELGVDGYRLDTVNFYFHDQELRDNPARGMPHHDPITAPMVNPYAWQWHVYDKSRPENLMFLQRLRTLLDCYPGTSMLGEVGDDYGLERVAEYTSGGDKLHMAYAFELLSSSHNATYLHEVLSHFLSVVRDGWPCWSISNHDVMRVATRWGGANPRASFLRQCIALLSTLRGTLSLYQGEELGLSEAIIPYEKLKDPYGITMWPEFKGRDGCRTPMPWDSSTEHGGFTIAQPWLPVARQHLDKAVNLQEEDPESLLHHYRRLLAWRKTCPAIVSGEMLLLDAHAQVFAFIRHLPGSKSQTLCVFNLSEQDVRWSLPIRQDAIQYTHTAPSQGFTIEQDTVFLAADAVCILEYSADGLTSSNNSPPLAK